MEQNKIDLFTATLNDKFSSEDLMIIRTRLENIDDSRFAQLQCLGYKTPWIMFFVAYFFGFLGVDRFMLGQVGLGLLKLLTCGGFGLWVIVDLFLVWGNTKKYNFDLFILNAQ